MAITLLFQSVKCGIHTLLKTVGCNVTLGAICSCLLFLHGTGTVGDFVVVWKLVTVSVTRVNS